MDWSNEKRVIGIESMNNEDAEGNEDHDEI